MQDYRRFKACLDFMGIKPDASTFDGRIRMQKLAYMLGLLFGKPFAADFGAYIRGPYSHDIAVEYYKDVNDKSKPELLTAKEREDS